MKVLIHAKPPTPVRRAQTPSVASILIEAPTPVEVVQTTTEATAARDVADWSQLTDDEVLEMARRELNTPPVHEDQLPPFRILTTEEVVRYLSRLLNNDLRKWFTRKDGTYVRAWIEEYVWYYDPLDKTVRKDLREWPEGPKLPTLHGSFA